jgi:hypothetical protein
MGNARYTRGSCSINGSTGIQFETMTHRAEARPVNREKPALHFAVFVDDTRSGRDWLSIYRQGMKGRTTLNQIDIKTNEQFDAERLDCENGFLFFPHCIEATPMREVAEAHQVALAQTIKDLIASTGARVVVAANFEGHLR